MLLKLPVDMLRKSTGIIPKRQTLLLCSFVPIKWKSVPTSVTYSFNHARIKKKSGKEKPQKTTIRDCNRFLGFSFPKTEEGNCFPVVIATDCITSFLSFPSPILLTTCVYTMLFVSQKCFSGVSAVFLRCSIFLKKHLLLCRQSIIFPLPVHPDIPWKVLGVSNRALRW